MSKNKGGGEGVQKPVQLPTYPKYDDKDRKKWANDYDRVEGELLKHHVVANNASTTTLGLRQLNTQFDRTVPPVGGEAAAAGGSNRHRSMQRSRTTEPDASQRYGALSPIMKDYSPGRSLARPRSAMQQSHNVTSSFTGTTSHRTAATDVAQTMLTLLDPPLQFRTSFAVDASGLELGWLRNIDSQSRPTPRLVTLETMREDRLVNPSAAEEVALNSPRSVFLLLKNGLNVQNLQSKPVSAFRSPSTTEDAALSHHGHYEERRKEMLQNLREDYRELTETVALNDVLDAVISLREVETSAVSSTLVNATKAKQKQADEINREKMNRQREFMEDARKRVEMAEERRVKNESDSLLRQKEKREESRIRLDEASKRQRELQMSTAALQKKFQEKVEKRRKDLEAKEEARNKSKAEQRAKLHKENEERARARQERLELTRDHQKKMREQQEEDFRRKEEEAAQRKALHDAEKMKEKNRLQEQLRHAEEKRLLAMQQAKQHELEEIRRAEEKRQHAEDKLQGYFNDRSKQREEQRKLERLKEQERTEKRGKAEQQAAERRNDIVRKRQEHDQLAAEIKQARDEHDFQSSLRQKHAQDDKGFYVERKANALEFQKLISVGSITRKVGRAEAIGRHRRELQKATLANREASRLAQEKFASELNMSY